MVKAEEREKGKVGKVADLYPRVLASPVRAAALPGIAAPVT